MSGKGKPFGRAKKLPAKPKADDPPKVENPPAQPESLTAEEAQAAYDSAPSVPLSPERIEEIVKYATAPAKPSEEAEAVLAVIVEEYESSGGDVEFLANDTMKAIATALVRRFPGLTRKPGLPRHAYEDARMAKRGRLPDGSIFLAVWDAADGVWYGKLVTAPATGLGGMLAQMIAAGGHFAASHTGVFGLLKRLDTMYRELLGRQKGGGK